LKEQVLSLSLEIDKDEWHGILMPLPNEIVGGINYPTCIACYEEKSECLWEFSVIKARMEGTEHLERRCEGCVMKGNECRFVWTETDAVSKVDDALNRLVRHAASEYRKTDRRIAQNEAAREGIRKAWSAISEQQP
jgi:hypothetical protein